MDDSATVNRKRKRNIEAGTSMDKIDDIQSAIEAFDEEAAAEIARIERKYDAKKLTLQRQRDQALRAIAGFWGIVFEYHPEFQTSFEDIDLELLRHLISVQVRELKQSGSEGGRATSTNGEGEGGGGEEEGENEDNLLGFAITFVFSVNNYFSTTEITREFRFRHMLFEDNEIDNQGEKDGNTEAECETSEHHREIKSKKDQKLSASEAKEDLGDSNFDCDKDEDNEAIKMGGIEEEEDETEENSFEVTVTEIKWIDEKVTLLKYHRTVCVTW